ncbi:DUF1707 domain-containing protein [Streptomyces sp. MST-110588]|uniref:DUF1707 SHOCT-like domain-containing protein n=1 Tax=Streptomyces sp. MST-110588 TaxID=2833628 RepID=UPI001F5C1B36|nr:DUF1707 domain-containing protein [Streptomyces sp. MST-110588]UNO41837.1 DUF1707 domain-containing protein [Streptomyces sp. MST-110588]
MTEELPELRASDTDRERVAEILREALAEGRLAMEEFDERLDAAYKARTFGELRPLTADLPQSGTGTGAALAPRAAGVAPATWRERIGGDPSSRGAFAFWGGFSRKGRWTAPRVFTAGAFQGGGVIDLRDANFEDRDITIRCIVFMAGMEVVVPPGVEVQVTGFGFMGGFEDSDHEVGDPDAPRVKITGFAMWGGVGLKRKASKAERQRLKAEREQIRLEKQKTDRLRKELD